MKRLIGYLTVTALVLTIAVSVVYRSVSAQSGSETAEQTKENYTFKGEESLINKKKENSYFDELKQWWESLTGAEREEEEEGDADLPDFAKGKISKADYMQLREGYIARLRGIDPEKPFDAGLRGAAIKKMERQETAVKESGAPEIEQLTAAWTYIGPSPITNGQTNGAPTAVSGRVTAIDIDPTDANIAYVGTAQGGLYRTTDGGTTWTPLMDAAQILAIGAVTVDPLDRTKVFVGTGEGNASLDSFFGVGLYRIDNANGAVPIVNGPFETRVAGTGTGASNGHAFIGTSINKIVVDPANDNRIFVGNTIGEGGLAGANYCCGGTTPPSGFIGLYFSQNALATTPVFSRVGSSFFTGVQGITDLAFEPGSSSNLLMGVKDFGGTAATNGVYRTTNAAAASQSPSTAPTFTQVLTLSQVNSKIAVNKAGSSVTVYVAHGANNGTLVKSTDGGATFSSALASATGFCGGQCFYDIAVNVDPADPNTVYLAGNVSGAATKLLHRSTDGGATFSAIDTGLHADAHSIKLAPSSSGTAYFGSDGGVWKSVNVTTPVNSAVVWTSLNNTTFSATQFQSVAVHPTDAKFTIGGTQDNGSELRDTLGVWRRADYGDGGYSLIDQNATDTVNLTMYHTYYNQVNGLVGYARVDTSVGATDNGWSFKGCIDGVTAANGINCNDSAVNFYAPLVSGPGNPNTIYYGTDRLYRSADKGATNTVVSQAPLAAGVPISTVGISPLNDNVRIVGLKNGKVFATTNGSSTLADVSTGLPPGRYAARAVVDPRNSSTAYVTFSAFDTTGASTNVWKTTNLGAASVTWTNASGTGAAALPNVPVNALVIDPLDSTKIYAGTDIGVYASSDGGATWNPFGTGLPRIAVFDLAIQPTSRMLRAATHGRGMFETQILSPTAASATVSGRVTTASGRGIRGVLVTMTDSSGNSKTAATTSFGYFHFAGVPTGETIIISASAKRFTFNQSSKVLNINEDTGGVDFVGAPNNPFNAFMR